MHLEKSEVIRKHISSVYKVLDLMCEKESKRQEGVNEVKKKRDFMFLLFSLYMCSMLGIVVDNCIRVCLWYLVSKLYLKSFKSSD